MIQYVQVKSLTDKIQVRGKLCHKLNDFEKLVLNPGQTHLLSKIDTLLLSKIMFFDIMRGRWQTDIQRKITDNDW